MTEIKKNISLKNIDKLIPYTHNPKAHPDEQIDKIASSIKNYGFDQPIVVDAENEIIKGHGRLEAAKKLGLEQVPVIKQGDLSEAQAKAARLADNKTAESDWKYKELAVEFEELGEMDIDLEGTGFEDEEIEDISERFEYPDEGEWEQAFETENDTSEIDDTEQMTFVLSNDTMDKLRAHLDTYDSDKNKAMQLWLEESLS